MNEDEALRTYDLDPWHPVGASGPGRFRKVPRAHRFLRQYSLSRLPEDPKLRERVAAFLRRQRKQDLAQDVTGRGKQ